MTGWNCPTCQTFWNDVGLGGASSVRTHCPFDGTPREDGRKIVIVLGKDEDERQSADHYLQGEEEKV